MRFLLLAGIAVVWGAGEAVLVRWVVSSPQETVVVTHWANIYMMDEPLLPTLSRRFNDAGYRTQSGRRIEVRPFLVNSGFIVEDLVSRIQTGHPSDICWRARGGCPRKELGHDLPEPTLATPAADHWLEQVNYRVGQPVIDVERSQALAASYTGIIMLREMARCLGWPSREIGIADILALRQDPRGWADCPAARTEWGKLPLISFTDPNSSSTARSALYSLYAMAAGKRVEDLTVDDLAQTGVTEYVRQFQRAVDHYVPDTVVLASKIYAGPRYGHFYFNLENQLITLYQGKTPVKVGSETQPRPLEWDMVMVYPKEGSAVHRHSAGIVRAAWVDAEQVEAAQRWITFLLQESQQRAFLEEGFRPVSSIPISCPVCPRFGVEPREPLRVFEPRRVDPLVANAIGRSWPDVKKQGVLTFVVDTSAVMAGGRLAEARAGVQRVLNGIDKRTLVGIVTFSSVVNRRIEPSPVLGPRFDIVEPIGGRLGQGSAMYEAIGEAVAMTDSAPADTEAIRGVVVITAGRASTGLPLHNLIRLVSQDGTAISTCSGFGIEADCLDDASNRVAKAQIHSTGWVVEPGHPVHVFYVGIGGGVDLEVGRLLAEATPGSSFEGATEQDLENVIEQFSSYF